MNFTRQHNLTNVKKTAMIIAVSFASFHLLFLSTIPQVFASTSTPVHHDLPADHSEEAKHSVCPTEIHQFIQKESAQQDISYTPALFRVTHLDNQTLHNTALLPIHTIGFAPPPKAQKIVLLI